MQLENNFQAFSLLFKNNANSALSNNHHLVESLCNILEDLILLWQVVSSGLWQQVIFNFSKFQMEVPLILQERKNVEQILTEFDEELNSKRDILAVLSGVKSMVKAAKDEIDNILERLKPYIKNAIFSNSEYAKVISYNVAAMNIYDILNLYIKIYFINYQKMRQNLCKH